MKKTLLSLVFIFSLFPITLSAEIYSCNGIYQNEECSNSKGLVRLPKLSSYKQQETVRFSIKGSVVEESLREESEPLKSDKTKLKTLSMTRFEKLRALEVRADSLNRNSQKILRDVGNQILYGKARTLLVEAHVLCSANFEQEKLSVADRCQSLRKQIAEVSRFATLKRNAN